LEQALNSRAPIHLCGEEGSGRRFWAQQIHRYGPASSGPFVHLRLRELTPEEMAQILFGRDTSLVGTAPTGAALTGTGKLQPGPAFREAQGGTLYIEGVEHLPYLLQGRLLRLIQAHRLGRCRLITSSLAGTGGRSILAQKVSEGLFRQDLFYRLTVYELSIPPLRQRKDDLLPLAELFLFAHSARLGKNLSEISKEVRQLLMAYEWPGNVAELKRVIHWGVEKALDFETVLQLGHLPDYLQPCLDKPYAARPYAGKPYPGGPHTGKPYAGKPYAGGPCPDKSGLGRPVLEPNGAMVFRRNGRLRSLRRLAAFFLPSLLGTR